MTIGIERYYYGAIVAIGGSVVKSLTLPDWSVDYIEFPPGKMSDYRTVLTQERVKIIKVTETRIYFEQ